MYHWRDKSVCIIGMGISGRAAAELLLDQGARVTAVDDGDSANLRDQIVSLQQRGADCLLGRSNFPETKFENYGMLTFTGKSFSRI